ncbi:MAG: NAD(P)/FAD-dependent oxidoreductase [Proteobacteria bacterium]|nr:NAD(P)/FAD-dependent oxidoreductase [Pseudomonadota bacterium]
MSEQKELVIVGAGLAGPLLSIYMARRGHKVSVYELRPDMREQDNLAGRSINLALAERGINALREAGALALIEDQLIVMRGRMIHHHDGSEVMQPYGQKEGEVIYSVSRGELNKRLMNLAEKEYGVEFHFDHRLRSLQPESCEMEFERSHDDGIVRVAAERVMATDGGGSIVRRTMSDYSGYDTHEEILPHAYKELRIPADENGKHRIDNNSLHIWPRGGFMLIALPNPGGDFTVTLFLPLEGPISFVELDGREEVRFFFQAQFPSAVALLPDLETDFFANPTGELGTVKSYPYHYKDKVLLLGDAAHAVVPFHGQGMNCAFEDCLELDRILNQCDNDWRVAFARFSEQRKPNCDAIADMALENYVEMRDSVTDPIFLLQKKLSFELENKYADRFIPRYSMVMFRHEIPYAEAKRRGEIQTEILRSLTAGKTSLDEVDFEHAGKLISEKLERMA